MLITAPLVRYQTANTSIVMVAARDLPHWRFYTSAEGSAEQRLDTWKHRSESRSSCTCFNFETKISVTSYHPVTGLLRKVGVNSGV
jgi:hypothetical protein